MVKRKRLYNEVKGYICSCPAYPFPHRPNSGKCLIDGHGPYCTNCGKTCTPTRYDDGFAYDYGSERGTHHLYYTASDCCGDKILDEEYLTKRTKKGATK